MSKDSYQVNEIFHSIQGEGFYMGMPATFIRLQGCPVGCSWCDTKYTWEKGGMRMPIARIVNEIKYPHIIITGGEPILYDLDPLLKAINDTGLTDRTQLETSGIGPFKGKLRPTIVTCSPKRNLKYDIHASLWEELQEVKFVVDKSFTLDEALLVIEPLNLAGHHPMYSFMPEGCPPTQKSVLRALAVMDEVQPYVQHSMYSDRLQYRIGVK